MDLCLPGMAMSPVVNMYGCRPIAVTSAIIFAAGMSLTAIAHNLTWMIVFYGLLGGKYFTFVIIQQSKTQNVGICCKFVHNN